MREFYRLRKPAVDKALFAAAAAAGLYLGARFLLPLAAPFAAGYLLAAAMEPLARFLCRRLRAGRWLAAFVCVALLVFVVCGAGVSAAMKLAGEARAFAVYAPGVVRNLTGAFRGLQERLSDFLPGAAKTLFSGALETAADNLAAAVGGAVTDMSLGIVANVPEWILGFVLTFIACFFFISDRQSVRAAFARLPAGLAGRLGAFRTGVLRAAAGYLRAECAVVSLIAGVSVAALLAVGYPYALLAGLAIAAADLLPVLGSGMILWPWAIFAFASGDYPKTAALIGVNAAIFVVRHAVGPRILGGQIGVHPLLTLAAMYAGLKLFGFWGLLAGPAAVVVVKAALGAREETTGLSKAGLGARAETADLSKGGEKYAREKTRVNPGAELVSARFRPAGTDRASRGNKARDFSEVFLPERKEKPAGTKRASRSAAALSCEAAAEITAMRLPETTIIPVDGDAVGLVRAKLRGKSRPGNPRRIEFAEAVSGASTVSAPENGFYSAAAAEIAAIKLPETTIIPVGGDAVGLVREKRRGKLRQGNPRRIEFAKIEKHNKK